MHHSYHAVANWLGPQMNVRDDGVAPSTKGAAKCVNSFRKAAPTLAHRHPVAKLGTAGEGVGANHLSKE